MSQKLRKAGSYKRSFISKNFISWRQFNRQPLKVDRLFQKISISEALIPIHNLDQLPIRFIGQNVQFSHWTL